MLDSAQSGQREKTKTECLCTGIDVHKWATKNKNKKEKTRTFHYTDWFIGIFIMAYEIIPT